MRISFFLIAFLAYLNSSARAADFTPFTDTSERAPQTFALIIGISDYKFIRPLTYADKDAELFRDFLKSNGGGKLAEENIYCLLNEDAKAANFWIKGMSWLRSKNLRNGDRLYIYMAGHGDAINSDEYFFLTYDCNPAGDKNNYIVTGNIQLFNLKIRIADMVSKGVDVYLIMDACRTNELPGGSDGQQILSTAISEKKSGEVIMLATGAGQESYEDASIGAGHGLFTYYLIDGLSGFADEGGNNDKKISLKEIQSYVGQHVPLIAQERFKKPQTPFICCPDEGDKDLVMVDSLFFSRWNVVKQLKNLSGSEFEAMSRSVAARGTNGFSDTSFIEQYVLFKKALKDAKLTGPDSSAEHFYVTMMQMEPASPYTLDARLSLASELVNYAQTKINLYLHGKDASTIQQIRSQLDEEENTEEINTSLERMEMIAKQEFSQTAGMLEKAIGYLEPEDSIIAKQLAGKVYFFKAHGFFDKGNRSMDYEQAMKYAALAYELEPDAAYVLNTMSSLHLQRKRFDSAIYYSKKASEMAPQWPLPYLNLAYAFNKLSQKDSALLYYRKAAHADQANADVYVDLGRFYYNTRQVDSAITYYTRALRLDSSNIYAHNNLGWILKEQRQFDNAIDHFRKSISYNTSYFNSYNGLSKVYSDMKQYDSARVYYQKAFEQYPDKIITSNYLGNFYKNLKQYDSALYYYKNAVQYDLSDNIPLINIGKLYEDLNNYDSAIHYYYRAADAKKDHRVLNQIGALYKQLNRTDSSKWYFQKAYEQNNYYLTALNNLAVTFQEERKFDSAIKYFNKAIALEPNNASLYNNIGFAYKEMRRLEPARKNLLKAIEINPSIISAYNNLGIFYRELRKYDSAKLYLKMGVEQNANNSVALTNLINIYKYLNQYDSAKYYYIKSVESNPTNPVVMTNLGTFYFDIKHFDSAIVTYRRAISIDPTYATAFNNLGTVYNEVADYDSAIYFYKEALLIDPAYVNAHFNLGLSYHNKGQLDSAIHYISNAIKLNPHQNYYYYYLACSYALNKMPAEALKFLETALVTGFKDYYTVLHDNDLRIIRNTAEYKALVDKYVPEKYKKQLEEENRKLIEEAKQKQQQQAPPPPPKESNKKGKKG